MDLLKKYGAALVLTAATSANAAIIDHNTYLTDTDTGLDWLDVTASVNLSFNYVESQFGEGGEFEGWRHATGDEFNALLVGWTGITNNGYGLTQVRDESLDPLIQMLGDTYRSHALNLYGTDQHTHFGYAQGEYDTYTSGFIADSLTEGSAFQALIFDTREPDNTPDLYAARTVELYKHSTNGFVGSFLVRDTAINVSEPGSLALIGLGLFGLGCIRKKTKN